MYFCLGEMCVCVCAFSQVTMGVLRFCWSRRAVDVLMGILSLRCTVLCRSPTAEHCYRCVPLCSDMC